jgi:hypothetical protein
LREAFFEEEVTRIAALIGLPPDLDPGRSA